MAAIFVLTRHTGNYWNHSFYRSYLAVDLFFILSGFVIAYAYDEKIKNNIITFRQFVLIRLIRLYPVFLLSLLICSLLLVGSLLTHQNSFASFSEALSVIALTALFLPSHMASNNSLFPINGPYWSLFFELVANFIYAAIRPILNNSVLAAIIVLFGLLVASASHNHGNLDIGFLWGSESVVGGFSRSMFGIFTGLFLYRHQAKFGHFFSRPNSAWLAFFSIAVILASPSAVRFNWLIDVISVGVVFPIAVLCASQGKSTRLQSTLVLLGSASYPIYVLHVPFVEILSSTIAGKVEAIAPVSGIILVTFLIALSVWIEKNYDIPFRRKLSSYIFQTRP